MAKPTDEFDFSRQRWEHLIDSYIFNDRDREVINDRCRATEDERQNGAFTSTSISNDGSQTNVYGCRSSSHGFRTGRADDFDTIFLRGDGHSSGRRRSDSRRHVDKVIAIAAKRDSVTILLDVAAITAGGVADRDNTTDGHSRRAGISRVNSRFTHKISPFIK